MNEKIEVPTMQVPPLKRICMTIGQLPTSYLETMSYYEMLVWFVNYLRDDIIPVVNANGLATQELQELFVELQKYVNDSFDELNLQEEVNNKLDEMLEDGVLEQIIEQYLNSTALWCFDTVSDMKSSTNLIEGSYAKTLGYYSKNDGGDGIYKIRQITNNDVIDNGFIVSLNNSQTLIAELIYEDSIKVNTLGADSTGTNDASLIIQHAIDYLNQKWLDEEYKVNTLIFNGTYKLNNTIELTPFVKLRGDGYVTFLTTSSPVIWIHYDGVIPASFPGEKLQYQYADLINFNKGCLFRNTEGTKQNTCIEIGEHSDLTTTHNVSRYKICNFAIENYNIGIFFNTYNVYICNHERLHIEGNTIAVKFGNNTDSLVNSGEHILFDNCLIAGSTYGFLYESAGFDIEVVNSSIDFNTYIVSDPYCKGYHKIAFSTSHIEGNDHFLGTIGYPSLINIINNKLSWRIDPTNKYEFMTTADVITSSGLTDAKLNVCKIENNSITIPVVSATYNPEYLYFNSYMNVYDIDNFYQSSVMKPQLTNGNILQGIFDNIADGNVTVSTDATLNNGQLKVSYCGNFQATGAIVTDNYLYTGHKSLVIYKYGTNTTNCSINLETQLLPVKKNEYIANWISYNKRSGGNIRFMFYDKDGNQLSQTDNYQNHPNLPTNTNEWYSSSYSKKVTVPLNAAYFKVAFNLGNWTNGTADAENTEYKIGGLIIN